MNAPIRILSDLHLGHRVSRITSVESLRPLIAGAATVVFNGDTWQELALPFRERSAVMLEELISLCRQEGAEPVFLSGNHDPGWPGTGWLELAEGKILITHGDALFFDGSPWSREAISGQAAIRELWAQHHAAADDAGERLKVAREIARYLVPKGFPKGKKLWQRAWEAACPPQRAIKMIHSWLTQAEAAVTFAEKFFPHAEVILIGHFHRSGIWKNRGRLVINTGAYLPPCAALWTEWNHGWLSCGQVDESSGHSTLGPTIARWRL
jgi:predicted phosphodiesterase